MRALMVQGTASHVGKSLLCAALCRSFARRGVDVAPFKAQNMALNSCVTPAGEEIARAQCLQARAAGVVPTADMNPLLLKPKGDRVAELIVWGRHHADYDAAAYQREFLPRAGRIVAESLARLGREHELLVIEGAGSPAEVNLMDRDVANMRTARWADAAVLLVGDIERGGIFASLLGTLDLLPSEDRARVAGLVVNKFRGDPDLLGDGLSFLEHRSGVPVLGVVPYRRDLDLPQEDSLGLDLLPRRGAVTVAVPRLPHMANFTDLDPLGREGVGVVLAERPEELAAADLVLLPGSKNTVADLRFLCETGLAEGIRRARERGAFVLGICGGYQMLGARLSDPEGVEDAPGDTAGLGLLDVTTRFLPGKRTRPSLARVVGEGELLAPLRGSEVAGYEIHLGRTSMEGGTRPAFEAAGEALGAESADGRVVGTYLHGLLEDRAFRRRLVEVLYRRRGLVPPPEEEPGQDPLDRWTDLVEGSLDLGRIRALVGL
ncbi:MAG: cobyric acid synthase [Thermaerobacter sp.]|nr:cobyric acid synthase [Thermaerobacter sp.]